MIIKLLFFTRDFYEYWWSYNDDEAFFKESCLMFGINSGRHYID